MAAWKIVIAVAVIIGAVLGQDAGYPELKAALFQNYDPDVRPGSPEKAVPLEVGISVTGMRIEEWHSALHTDAFLRLQWVDERLTWTPEDFSGIKTLRLPAAAVWNPDLALYNELPMFSTEEKALEKLVLILNNGTVLWVPNVSLKSTCQLDFTNFPYDQHSCSIKMGSWTYDKSEIDLQLFDPIPIDNSTIVESPSWELLESTSVKNDVVYPAFDNVVYPNLEFIFQLKRKIGASCTTLFAPLITSVLFGFAITLINNPSSPGRTGLMTVVASLLNVIVLSGVLHYHKDLLVASGSNVPRLLSFVGVVMVLEIAVLLPLRVIYRSCMAKSTSARTDVAAPLPCVFKLLAGSVKTIASDKSHADKEALLAMTNKQENVAEDWARAARVVRGTTLVVHIMVPVYYAITPLMYYFNTLYWF